jgi:DNA repair exonuclease SbcCD ATPase subunit
VPVELKETNDANPPKTAPQAADAAQRDDAFSLFLPESPQSADRAPRSSPARADAMPRRETPPRIALENAAALKQLDHNISRRSSDVEHKMFEVTRRVDEAAPLMKSFADQFASLTEQAAHEAATLVADLERRATHIGADLERRLIACQTQDHLVAQTVEQLARRAAEAAAVFARRANEFEIRTHSAERALTELLEPTSRSIADLEQRLRDVDAKTPLLDHAIAEATGLLSALAAFHERLPDVTRCDQERARLEHAVPQIAQHLADLTANVEQHVAGLEAQKLRVQNTLEETRGTSDVLDRLGSRIAELTKKDLLDPVDQHVQQLEQRIATVRERLPDITTGEQDVTRIEHTLPQLARQLDDLNASIEQHVAGLEARKQRVQNALEETRRTSDVLVRLETRIADLKNRQHQLEPIDQQVGKLEQRISALAGRKPLVQQTFEEARSASEVMSALEARLADLAKRHQQLDRIDQHIGQIAERVATVDAKKKLVQQTLNETQKVSDVLSGLEARIADLIKSDERLGRIEKHVGQLERRAAAAVGELNQATRSKSALEHEFTKLQDQIKRLTTNAHDDAAKLIELRRQRDGSSLNQAPVRHSFDPSPLFRLGRQAIDAAQSVPRMVLIAGGVAIVLVLGVMAARATWSSIRSRRPASSAPAAVLASRAIAVMPIMLPTAIGHDIPAATERPQQPVALVAAAGNVSLDTRPPEVQAAAAPSIDQPRESRARTPQLVGTLAVDSEPPGAAVFINQRPVGVTPVVLKELRAGSSVLRLELEGYQRWSSSVTVSTVRETHVLAKLQPDSPR